MSPCLDRDFSGLEELGLEIQTRVSLAPMTAIRVGGVADYLATVTSIHQLLKLVRWCRSEGLAYFILGGGSNILISDAGIRGLVINNRCRGVRIDKAPCNEAAYDDRPYLMAESGAAMAGVARRSVNEGLAGLEWAVSVPGTVGGAVIGNAGAHGGEVKDNLVDVLLLDDQGDLQEFKVDEMQYAYRRSTLKRKQNLKAGFGPVVLSANFRMQPGDKTEIKKRAHGFLAHRRRTQPAEPSLGSTFVNPEGDFAGRLIEAAGLKGAAVGGAQVSSTHANFIINPKGAGGASAADIMALIEHIQMTVESQFGINLEREVQLAGEW